MSRTRLATTWTCSALFSIGALIKVESGESHGESVECFLTNARFREGQATGGPVGVWLNVDSRNEVNELYQCWEVAGARILIEPDDKPWHLREFLVADLHGNQSRVFYDFSWELQDSQP